MTVDLAPTNSYGLVLRNPLMIAAGCLGYGIERAQLPYLEQIGALITPTTYLRRRGAPTMLIEMSGGIVVTGSWPGRSIDVVLGRYAPIWAKWHTPVLLSIAGSDQQAAVDLSALLEGIEGLAGIELACTEIETALALSAVVKAVRGATFLPLLVKLPTHPADLVGMAQAAAHAGADALVVGAPSHGEWYDPEGKRSRGWLCGPAQHPVALARVAQVAEAIQIPIIGAGGIIDAAGAQRMLSAGACAVQVGSALLADPGLATRLAAHYQS